MYAVIRSGGKQYRVAPGDVVKLETMAAADDGTVEFGDVLAVNTDGKLGKNANARVVGQVMEEGKADKILVFHYKKKKQYKKLNGHRQGFTAVRITQISVDGQTFDAPALPAKKVKAPKKAAEAGETIEASAAPARAKKANAKPAKKAAPKETAAKKAPAKKSAAKKSSKK
jgi:large subunit ribosomal protein L21